MTGPTKLLYLEDMMLYRGRATIQSIACNHDKMTMLLDQTVFYPQGGGQPSDTGTIKWPSGNLQVTMVKKTDGGLIEHEGIINGICPESGQEVTMEIDVAKRQLHSRIHSAGHLLDHAAEKLLLPIVGEKGYHFPAGPYVEYRITDARLFDSSPNSLNKLKNEWSDVAQQIISEQKSITIKQIPPHELSPSILSKLNDTIKASELVRLVYFEGSQIPGPCGGTHVANTSELAGFKIRKINYRNGTIRVCYQLED